jgi:predicted transposase YdaD
VALVADLRFDEFRGKLEASAPQLKEITMTMAEQLRLEGWNRGRNEGLIEGRNEGLINTLRKQLTLKFGVLAAEHEARISAASVDELDRYLERILTAETLGSVFAA